MPKIFIPTSLAQYVNGKSSFLLNFDKLNELSNSLRNEYLELYNILYDDFNQLKSFVCIYLNSQFVRNPSKENRLIHDQDSVQIILAIAGG